jgi:hypothetical protein
MFPSLLASISIVFCTSMLIAQRPVQTTAVVSPAEQVAAFAEAAMNTKVGTGECWDLAQFALNRAGAKWDGRYEFGRKIDTRTGSVQRGDVVQFSKVLVERRNGNSIEQETMGHHTAIVLEVHEPGRCTLAHQNFGPAGRKVGRYELVMADVKRGTITFFRPVF